MNIVVLSGSPRKGANTDTMVEAFAETAREAGHTVEVIRVAGKKIAGCLGCQYCFAHEGACVQKDDMAEILDKMVAADVIVLATPVYFYTMDGQMKTLIDRTVPRYTEMTDKEFYYIMTAADTERANLEKTVEGLRGFTLDCLDRAVEKGILYGVGAWEKGDILRTPAVQQAYEMGKAV